MTRSPVVMVLMLLGACASNGSRLPPLPEQTRLPYVLGSGDTLQVIVFGEPDLSGSVRVSESGMIAMPLVGQISAQGLTVEQLRQTLVARLDANAVRSPNVTLAISEYRPFFILGEVAKPGLYPYVPNMTVLTAVAVAGGFTYRASEKNVSITRVTAGASREWRAERAAIVLPGDVINVFERHF